MCQRLRLIGLFGVVLAALATPGFAFAQYSEPHSIPGRGEIIAPIPTGKPDENGFWGALQLLVGSQSFALGNQDIAVRGLIDSSGLLTGQPGTYIGNGEVALRSGDFGRKSYQPGYQISLGYKFDNGLSVYGKFGQLTRTKYSAGASGPSPAFFRARTDLADTFLLSPVFNFSPEYSGPDIKTPFDLNLANPIGNFNGIWNGAIQMDIQFEQAFTQGEIGARVPLFETDYSRVYGFGGGRHAWFFERFYWRTVATDIDGISFPRDVAIYTNTLSQRMYGPYLGCGHEIYVGKSLALSLDLSGAALIDLAKQRVKYKLGDESTSAKRKRIDYEIVPNINLDLNWMWYPIEGVQLQAGYSFQSYFGTRYMKEPVAFNFGALDPATPLRGYRYVSLFTFGVGFFF
jgi:hypothetical protein